MCTHTQDKTPEDLAKPYIFYPDKNLHAKSTKTKSIKLTKSVTIWSTYNIPKMATETQY